LSAQGLEETVDFVSEFAVHAAALYFDMGAMRGTTMSPSEYT
jgi:hypothetical protein